MGKILKFNGTSTYAILPLSLGLENGSSTRSFWLKVSGTANYAIISDYPSNVNLAIDIISSKVRYYRAGNPSAANLSETVTVGNWIHVTLTRDIVAGVIKCYTNGVQTGTATDPKTSIVGTTQCRLGSYVNGATTGPFYNGVMTDVKFWNVAISSAEAMSVYKGASVALENLLAHYKLTEGTGTTLLDYSGNGNNIIAVNGTWIDDVLPSVKNPKMLVHANNSVYTYKSNTWENLGTMPPEGEMRDDLYFREGMMSSITPEQLEALKVIVPSNKFRLGYYTGPRRFPGAAFVDHPDPFGDDSGLLLMGMNGTHLDKLDNVVTPVAITYATGKFGQAAVFNGTSSYINLGTILAKRKKFTISFWLKKATAISYHGIMGNYIGSGFWLQTDAGGRLGMAKDLSTSGTIYSFGSRNICDNAYHHIAVTKTDKSVILYIDGTVELNLVASTDWEFSVEPLYLGMLDISLPRLFPGQIDQLRMFNRALTPTEILRLYAEE